MTHPDIPPAIRGTFAALGHPASIAHLTRLGITTVELMPSAAWVDERHLPPLNLSNYWGYNPIAFLAPDPTAGARRLARGPRRRRCAARSRPERHPGRRAEPLRRKRRTRPDPVDARPGQCRLLPAGRRPVAYVNDAGCGNILAMDRPAVLRLGMDALRAWALYGGIDGFRLDLATTLGRRDTGFDRDAPFLAAVEQDPVLSRCVMIAEPWDIGPGGYQLGAFPAALGRVERPLPRHRPPLLARRCRHAGRFHHALRRIRRRVRRDRPLSRSINYVTAHDGFTLADLVSYETKHNHANGEDNRDGSNDNLSWNNGAEGPSADPAILAARARDVRALLATLLLSRGTPMLSMGDELGRTQHGNNNAYAQDNAGSWIDWATADAALIDFTARADRAAPDAGAAVRRPRAARPASRRRRRCRTSRGSAPTASR